MNSLQPFLKWVGGKTQILNSVFSHFPKKIEDYYEPFCGGGSIFLELIRLCEKGDCKVENFYINDINTVLIETYKMIKNDVDTLLELLSVPINDYKEAKMIKYPARYKYNVDICQHRTTYVQMGKSYVYYYYRAIFNDKNTEMRIKCALFIFLNKTCFRGLYREGKNGFNVPFGNYQNPSIINPDYIKKLNKLFVKYDVHFYNQDFLTFLNSVKKSKKSFVYLDPPYYPVKKESFTGYNEKDFKKDDFDKLAELCKKLKNQKTKLVHSNSDCEYNLKTYKDFNIEKVLCKRRINSKNPESQVYEIIIYN